MRCLEPGRPPVHHAGRGDTLRLRAGGFSRGHPPENREGSIRHELRQLVHRVQPRQGHRDQDAGCQPSKKTDNAADPGASMDDVQESADNKPSQTGFSAPQGFVIL